MARKKFKEWATVIGQGLIRSQVPLTIWTDLIFEMFLGKETEFSSLKSMEEATTTNYMNMQNPYRQRLLLGVQSYGMTAISTLLVKLTFKKEAFCYFHISRGQILNFPLTEDSYIQASSYIEPAAVMALDPEPNNPTLYRFDGEYEELAMRVDVELCWAVDPRTVLFVLRSQGIPIATLNIFVFLDRISHDSIPCSCQKYVWEVPVPATERWQPISLYQLLRLRFKGMSNKRVDTRIGDTKVLIDASQSIAATIYAVSILHTRHFCVAEECLACAYDHVMRNGKDEYAAIVIPVQPCLSTKIS